MFCPNCGTENDDSAKTCKKCGFNLKGAAAPKFKGTMLMMNSPAGGGAPGVPRPGGAPAAGAPRPADKPAPSKLKGTMLGVAPPSMGAAPAPPAAAPPAAAPPAAAPPGGAPPAAGGFPQPAPGGAGDVNPLGGTMVADQPGAPGAAPWANPGAVPPGGAPPGGAPGMPDPGAMGAPPGAPGMGAPPGAPGMGAPPGAPGMGAPPGAPMGAPPGAPMGAPGAPPGGDPGAYGAPPGGAPGMGAPGMGAPGMGAPGMGAPGMGAPGAMAPAGAPPDGGAMVPAGGMAPMPGAHGPIGKTRNPIMVLILSSVTCGIYGLIAFLGMLGELKAFRQKDDINLIMFFIPILNLLEMMKLSDKVAEAKRMAGSQKPAASGILYILLGIYFLPADLNDVWEAAQRSGG